MITRTSRGTKRFMAAAAAVAMIGSTLAISSAASAGAGISPATSARVDGANRFVTAINAADAIDTTPAEIVIVNGFDFPDGLAAAGFSIAGPVPTLLTAADALPAEMVTYLTAIQSGTPNTPVITIVGGTSVVSSAVFEALDDLNGTAAVTRIAGANRYATALAVATETLPAGTHEVILATGLTAADALSAGPRAAASSWPITTRFGTDPVSTPQPPK